MTNITYFYNTIREYYSSSSSSASSSFSDHQTLQHCGAATEVKVEDDDNSTISGPVSKAPLLNVALDAAKGLAFLHSSQIVHGCFNASSIVLDPNNNAKLFGFELTKNCPTKFPIGVMETPSGDFGYTIGYEAIYDAPEYLYRGEISAKSDVYSFGVVFLEILFGRRAFGKYWKFWSLAEQNLVEWITSYPSLKPQFVDVLHSCIYCQLKGGENAVLLALRCVSVEVKFRPTMDEVVKALEELLHENKMAKLKYLSPSRISTMMEV